MSGVEGNGMDIVEDGTAGVGVGWGGHDSCGRNCSVCNCIPINLHLYSHTTHPSKTGVRTYRRTNQRKKHSSS